MDTSRPQPEGHSGAGVSRRFAWTWALAFAAATALPYLLAAAAAPAGTRFTWILPPYGEDGIAYFAWVRQAELGRVLFTMKYTALPHGQFLFLPFFLVIGWLVRLTALPAGVVMLAAKSVGVACFWLAFFRLAATFRLDRRETSLAAVLTGATSGLGGWWALAAGADSTAMRTAADLWLPDVNTLWSLVWNPLFPLSLALALLAVASWERATTGGEAREVWIAGAALGGLALVHPYVVPVQAVALTLIGVRRLRVRAVPLLLRVAAALLVPAAIVAASYWLNPLLRAHGDTGAMNAATVGGLALGLGAPLLLAVAGMAWGGGGTRTRLWPLAVWVAVGAVGCSLPVWFQHKLILGLHVPVCIVAATTMAAATDRLFKRRYALVAAALTVVAFGVPSHALNVRAAAGDLGDNKLCLFRLSDDLAGALAYLRRATDADDVVLASLRVSALVPAYAGNTVIWGHWAQTVDMDTRSVWLRDLLASRSPLPEEERVDRLAAAGIRYVVGGGACRDDANILPPKWLVPRLRPLFAAGRHTVYELPPRRPAAP